MPDPFKFGSIGLCGRENPRPCRLVWSSTFPNDIGTYPSKFLPARRTIWHATFDTRRSFSPPIIDAGDFFTPIGGLIGVSSFGPPQFDSFTFQSFHTIIFARTANRINIPHVVTQKEIDKGEIDLGEFVFEVV